MRTALVVLMAGILSMIAAGPAGAEPGDPPPDLLTLTGLVTLAEPAPLPADALLTVTLEDVSRADAPAVTLAQSQVYLHGQQAPIPFSLVYPGPAVQPGASYAVRARVTQRERLLFTTTERNAVDALAPVPVTLVMTAVAPMDPPPTPDASLTDTYWKLVAIDGRPVVVTDAMREPSLVLQSQQSQFAGSGGVNRLMGGYTLAGDSLTFAAVASTMMAGPPEAMAQEQAIVAALPTVRRYAIAGDQLTLLGDAGQPVLKAVAVALR